MGNPECQGFPGPEDSLQKFHQKFVGFSIGFLQKFSEFPLLFPGGSCIVYVKILLKKFFTCQIPVSEKEGAMEPINIVQLVLVVLLTIAAFNSGKRNRQQEDQE